MTQCGTWWCLPSRWAARWLLGDSYVTHSRKKHQTSQLSAKAVSQDKKNFQTHAKVSIPTCASCFNDVHQGLSRLNCIIGICMGIQLGPCHGTLKMCEVLKMVDILTFLFFVVWGKWICSQFFWKKQQLQNRTGGHSSLGCHVGQPRMHPPSSLQTLVPKECCNFGDIKTMGNWQWCQMNPAPLGMVHPNSSYEI